MNEVAAQANSEGIFPGVFVRALPTVSVLLVALVLVPVLIGSSGVTAA